MCQGPEYTDRPKFPWPAPPQCLPRAPAQGPAQPWAPVPSQRCCSTQLASGLSCPRKHLCPSWLLGGCGMGPCPTGHATVPSSCSLSLTAPWQWRGNSLHSPSKQPGAANSYPIYLLAFHCSRFKCIRLERNTRNEPKLERNIKIQQKIEYEYNPVLETSASTSFTFCKYLYNRQIHGSTDSYLPTHRIAWHLKSGWVGV